MKWLACLIVAMVACTKSAPQGLPPAQDWSSNHGSGSREVAPPAKQELPPDHPPIEPKQGKMLARLPNGRAVLGPYTLAVPADWTEAATTSDMRAAQFTIGSDAELVVYYFGADGAGDAQANIDRWLGQFTPPDGKPAKSVAKIETQKILGSNATIVSVTGRYKTSAMPGGPAPVDKDDQALLAAITGSPDGPYYWKLVGGRATVAAHTAKFRTVLSTLALK